ncbi:MAG: phosphotransferase [Patescibacteria group bacterium]
MKTNESQINKFKKIIKQDYPDFKIESIKLLKAGWCNFVVEINKTYIFRFPKKDDVDLDLEAKILKILKGRITLEIPVYEFFGKKSSYVGYKKITGQPLTATLLKSLSLKSKQLLASDMANFLYEFHKLLPITKAKQLNLGSDNHKWRPEVIQKYVIGKLRNKKLLDFIEINLDKYLELIKDKSNLIIAYNDLHQNNIAFNKKSSRLNGIFDFGDVAVEHISIEFYRLFSFDPELATNVIKQYKKISGRKISVERVFGTAVVSIAAMLGVYNRQPNSKKYKDALNDLLRLKSLKRLG